jgi:hypothetical protein
MAQQWPQSDTWYEEHMQVSKEADIAAGFGFNDQAYRNLKESIEKVALEVKTDGDSYRGNSNAKRKAHTEEFCRQLPQFNNAPQEWREAVIPRIIGKAHANYEKRAKYTHLFRIKSEETRTGRSMFGSALQPQRQTAPPTGVTASPFHANTPITPAATAQPEPIDIQDIEFEIRSADLTEPVGLAQVRFLKGTQHETLLSGIQDELRAYSELEFELSPAKHIYLSPWKMEKLPIRTENTLQSALSDMAKSGTRNAILVAATSPPWVAAPANQGTSNSNQPSHQPIFGGNRNGEPKTPLRRLHHINRKSRHTSDKRRLSKSATTESEGETEAISIEPKSLNNGKAKELHKRKRLRRVESASGVGNENHLGLVLPVSANNRNSYTGISRKLTRRLTTAKSSYTDDTHLTFRQGATGGTELPEHNASFAGSPQRDDPMMGSPSHMTANHEPLITASSGRAPPNDTMIVDDSQQNATNYGKKPQFAAAPVDSLRKDAERVDSSRQEAANANILPPIAAPQQSSLHHSDDKPSSPHHSDTDDRVATPSVVNTPRHATGTIRPPTLRSKPRKIYYISDDEDGEDDEYLETTTKSKRGKEQYTSADDEYLETTTKSKHRKEQYTPNDEDDKDLDSEDDEDLDSNDDFSAHDNFNWGQVSESEMDNAANADTNAQKLMEYLYASGKNNLDTALAHVTEEDIRITLQYFPLLTEQDLKGSQRIRLPNWGLKPLFDFNPYQVVCMAWAFNQERQAQGGGIIADEPGAGKTIEMLGIWIMNYWHYQNRLEVEDAWKRSDTSRHLPRDYVSAGAKCPSASKQSIRCFCEDIDEELYPIPAQQACTVILTPSPGLRGFVTDAESMLQGGEIMKRPYPPRLATLPLGFEDNPMFGPLSPKEWRMVRKDVTWEKEEEDERVNNTFQVNKRDQQHPWSAPKFQNALPAAKGATSTLPPPHSAHFALLVTRPTLSNRLERPCVVTRTTTWKFPTQNAIHKLHSYPKNALLVGRVLWDECHLDAKGRIIIDFIEKTVNDYRQATGHSPAIWGASGTPNNGNPLLPFRLIMRGLWKEEWQKKNLKGTPLESLLLVTTSNIAQKKRLYTTVSEQAMVNPAKAMKHPKLDEFAAFFRQVTPLFQIKRGGSTVWFNGEKVVPKTCTLVNEIVDVVPDPAEAAVILALEQEVRTEQKRRYEEALEEWIAAGSNPYSKPAEPDVTNSASYFNARTAASVAQVVEYWLASYGSSDNTSMSRGNTLVKSWIKNPLADDFTKLLDRVFVGNAKLRELKRICDKVQNRTRVNGSRSKIVVAVRSPVTQACWHNRLVK